MFGDTLRRIRVRDGLKQSEFSKKLGVPPHSYSAIERGKVRSGSKFLPRILKSFDNPEDTHAVEEAYKQMKEEDDARAAPYSDHYAKVLDNIQNDSRIFTLYQGAEKVGTGTLSEVASMINVKVTTLYTYNSNGYRYKNKSNPNIRTLVPEGETFIPPASTKNIFGDALKQIRKTNTPTHRQERSALASLTNAYRWSKGDDKSMSRIFVKGEKYRPIALVDKVKKDIPTVLIVSGRRYVLDHDTRRKKSEKHSKGNHGHWTIN